MADFIFSCVKHYGIVPVNEVLTYPFGARESFLGVKLAENETEHSLACGAEF